MGMSSESQVMEAEGLPVYRILENHRAKLLALNLITTRPVNYPGYAIAHAPLREAILLLGFRPTGVARQVGHIPLDALARHEELAISVKDHPSPSSFLLHLFNRTWVWRRNAKGELCLSAQRSL